jgi:NhaP-type Na+/H+ or K+/H+ antiporter
MVCCAHDRRKLLENAIILVAPFALYLGAEELHSSGFLAVVVAGQGALGLECRSADEAQMDVVGKTLEARARSAAAHGERKR